MAARRTLSTRWVTVILVAALICSVGVVWGLIQVTGQSPASSSQPSTGESASVSGSASNSGSVTPGSPTTSTVAESAGGTALSTPQTPIPTLPGSGLALPAAWTGTAELTITVLGRCAATGGTSGYTRTADLALQGPVQGSGPYDDPNPLSMTLGITPAGIPGLSILSATNDQSGGVHRTWWLSTGAEADGRTTLSGVLIDDQPVRGVLPPNLLVDNETDLQPCETGGTVRVARTLAARSRLTGWVSDTDGHLDLTATSADGERAVTAVVTLTRTP